MTKAEYARHIGKTKTWVDKYIQQGVLVCAANGDIIVAPTNQSVADNIEIGRNTMGATSGQNQTSTDPATKAHPPNNTGTGIFGENMGATLIQAKTREKLAQAEQAVMDLKLRRRELLSSDEVRKKYASHLRRERMAVESLWQQLAVEFDLEGDRKRRWNEIFDDWYRQATADFERLAEAARNAA